MKNNKEKKFTLFFVMFIVSITLFFYTSNKFKTENLSNKINYNAVTEDTSYYDWSSTEGGPLVGGYLPTYYSYSNLFYTENTKFIVYNNPGKTDTPQTSEDKKIKLPHFTDLKSGTLTFLITNCAMNKNGEMLDVLVKVGSIKTWDDTSSIRIRVVKYFNYMDSQNKLTPEEPGYDYREPVGVGTPISFLLHTEGKGADCQVTLKYYKAGTYDSDNDTGTLGGIEYVNSFFNDMDVYTSSVINSSLFLDGAEGFAPNTGKSYIYYNKNGTPRKGTTSLNVTLEAKDNGISTQKSGTTSVDAMWYQSSAFMATNTITNSTFKFKYGGHGCGIWFMFASPYPYSINEPSKKATVTESTIAKKYTYKISQYVPNNYYGNLMNFSEVFDEFPSGTNFSKFVLSDTFDSNLEILTDEITVKKETGEDVTSWFTITVTDNKVTATAKTSYFSKFNFYNNRYVLNVPVKMKTGIKKEKVSNSATFNYKLASESAVTHTSNNVDVNVYYNITVKHLEQETNKELAPSSTIKAYYNDDYTTSKSSAVSSNYELIATPSNASGKATKNDTVTYYYKLKKGTVTVRHYVEGTTTKLANDVTIVQDYTTAYTTSPANVNPDYELVSTPSNASGTVYGNIVVTYYYRLKKGTLTVHHYKEGTTTKLADDVIKKQNYTTQYTTSPATVDPNYELVSTPSNASGTFRGNIVVTYYYRLKKGTITVHHYIEGTTTKLSNDIVTTQDYTTPYTTSPAIVDSNYELVGTPNNASGTVNGNITVTYYYRQKSATLTVHHYKEGTTTKLADTETSTVYWGNNYDTNASSKVSPNYEYSSVTGTTSGIVSGNITVIYYYKLKVGTITVHHYIEDTNNQLADDIITTQDYTTPYTTSPAIVDSNYELVGTPNNATGTVNGNITVTYYYRLKKGTITVHHYIEGTTTKLADDETKTQNYTTTYTTSPAVVNKNYELVSTPNNATGIVNGNIIVTYYYKLKEATLTVNHYIEGTTTKLADTENYALHWGDKYTTKAASNISVNYKIVSTPPNATGTIAGDVIVNYYYNLKDATLTVHHYIEGTTSELSNTIQKGVNWGESYVTTPAEVDINYELVGTPNNATGTISGDTTVIYYYRLKTATITVHHYIEGTTTKLAEDVVTTQKYTTKYTTSKATVNSNYELVGTPNNASGTVNGNITVTYYYRQKSATLTVNHYIEGTTTKLADTEISTVYWGNEYSTSQSPNVSSNYELSRIDGNSSGTVNGNITVTYYYKKKVSQLIVKHLEDQTNIELAPITQSTVYYGDTYTTDIHKDVPDNYELLRKTSNYTGVVSTNTIEVIYYYQKKDSSLNTSITKEGPKEITKKDEISKYKITYTASVVDYIGNGTITIIDTLPYKINEELSNLDSGTYTEETNTITWIIPWNNIDSFNNNGSITIEKNISLVYSDLIPTDRIMVNSVKGSIKLDNNSRDTESQTSTDIKIPGTIIVHHYIKDTKIELIPDEKFTELVGETLSTEALKKEGYIVYKPEQEIYTFTEEQQEIIYEYEKIKFNIKTSVDGTGGIITGDEEVPYGEDSTKDKIVIKPEDGYVLSEVYINGVKIELTEEERERLILKNFTGLKEDMNIVVKFIRDEKVLDNVATGTFANFIIILITILFGTLIYLKINKNKLIKLK